MIMLTPTQSNLEFIITNYDKLESNFNLDFIYIYKMIKEYFVWMLPTNSKFYVNQCEIWRF